MSAFDKKTARKKKRTKKIDVKLAKVDVKKSEKFVWAPLHSEIFLKRILLTTFGKLWYENMVSSTFKSIISFPILIFKFNYKCQAKL